MNSPTGFQPMRPRACGEGSPAPLEEPRLSRLALVLILALPALTVNPWARDLFGLPKEAAVQLLIAAALMGAVLAHRQRELWIPTSSSLSIPLVGLLFLGGLSASRSLDPLFSSLEVFHLALLVLLFHLLLVRRGAVERVSLVFRTRAIVGGAAALYGLAQLVGFDPVHTQNRFVPYSFFGHRNFAAEYILLVLPPALALTLLAASRRALILWSGVSGLLVLHLAATQTRAALVGLTLGLVGTALFWRRSSRIQSGAGPSGRRWLLVGGILAAGYLLFLFPQPFKGLEPLAAHVLSSEGWKPARVRELATHAYPGRVLADPSSLQSRILLWGAGLQLIRDHPWTGVGPLNVAVVFPMGYEPIEYWWPEWFGEPFLHNELLQVTAELGLPALLLVLLVIALVSLILCRSLRMGRPHLNLLFLAGSLCSLISIGVDSLFSFPWHLPAHRLYAVVHGACLVTLASDGRTRGIRMARSTGFVVAGACLLLAALGPVRLQIAEIYATAGWEALNRGARAEALVAHRRASSWFPQMFTRNELFRQALDPRPQYDKAVRQFSEAVQHDPSDQVAFADLGRALLGAGRLEEAHDVFYRLLEKTPGDAEILRSLIELALARGRPGEAIRHYEALTARVRCDTRLLFNIGVGYHRSGQRQSALRVWKQAVACDPALTGLPEAWLQRFGE